MWCPRCASKTRVTGTVVGTQNERFRKCSSCGYTFQTVEAIKFDEYWREYARQTFEDSSKSKEQREQESK